MSLPYIVPGEVEVRQQPNANACWATAYTMLKSWKQQNSLDIRTCVNEVDQKYGQMFDAALALPSTEFGPFLDKAGVTHLPMINLSIAGWEQHLRAHGLLWVGVLASLDPGSGLHSRLLEGMRGDGSPAGTSMLIVDPGYGNRYAEPFADFVAKYEQAINSTGKPEYYQVRFFS